MDLKGIMLSEKSMSKYYILSDAIYIKLSKLQNYYRDGDQISHCQGQKWGMRWRRGYKYKEITWRSSFVWMDMCCILIKLHGTKYTNDRMNAGQKWWKLAQVCTLINSHIPLLWISVMAHTGFDIAQFYAITDVCNQHHSRDTALYKVSPVGATGGKAHGAFYTVSLTSYKSIIISK